MKQKDLYLITGFLGSGKTTALRELARYFTDKKLAYVINEFSGRSVDANLVDDLAGLVEEINHGLISCVCKLPEFEDKLTELAQMDLDAVLVEASGLADPTQIREIMRQTDLADYHFRGVICLLDAARFQAVNRTSRIVPKQIAVADFIILNKTDKASEEEIAAIERQVSLMKPRATLIRTSYARLPFATSEEFHRAMAKQAETPLTEEERKKPGFPRDYDVKRIAISVKSETTRSQMEHFLKLIADDSYRIKGLCRLSDSKVWYADCVGPYVEVSEFKQAIRDEEGLNYLNVLYDTTFKTEETVPQAADTFDGLFTIESIE